MLVGNNNKQYQDDEIGFKDIWQIINKRKVSIFLIFISVLAITILLTIFTPKNYESSALIMSAKIQGQLVEEPEIINVILKQEVTLRELATTLKIPSEKSDSLIKQFEVLTNNETNSELIKIKGFGPTPETAKKITEVVSAFIFSHQEDLMIRFNPDLESEIDLLNEKVEKNEAMINDFEAKIKSLEKTNSQSQGVIAASYINNLMAAKTRKDDLQSQLFNKKRELNFQTQKPQFITSPFLPLEPTGPNKLLNLVLGSILAILVSVSWAFIKEYLDTNKNKI